MRKNEFYIGYLPKAPGTLARWLRGIIAVLLALLSLVAVFVAGNQQPFAETYFEYGKSTQLKGVVSLTPVPRLIVKTGVDLKGQAVTKSILLVNFGKSGAAEIFYNVEKTSGRPLTALEFTLQGSLIYGEGKVVFELTDRHASVLDYVPLNQPYSPVKMNDLGEQSIYGEIIDPKCYFGVMKPGFGKVHRSCAIRCISGGISPVMVTKNENGYKQFILLTADNSATSSHKISKLAGKPLTINGQLTQMDDWLVLHYNEQELAKIQHQKFVAGPLLPHQGITICN